jgi:hypothetical protein
MKNIRRIVIQLGSAVVVSAFLSSSLSAMTPFDFQIVELAGVPLLSEPVYLAIRTREEWLAFTKLRSDWQEQPPPLPGQILTPAPQHPVSEIDFDKYSVLVISIGPRTGYSIALEQVRAMGKELSVKFVVLKPGKDCMVAQVVQLPLITALIPRTTKPVRFNEVTADIDCSNSNSIVETRKLLEKK